MTTDHADDDDDGDTPAPRCQFHAQRSVPLAKALQHAVQLLRARSQACHNSMEMQIFIGHCAVEWTDMRHSCHDVLPHQTHIRLIPSDTLPNIIFPIETMASRDDPILVHHFGSYGQP